MRLALFAFILLLLPVAVFAAEPPAAPSSLPAALPAGQQQAVKDAEAYLNGITTLRAKFIQTDNDGKQQNGTFLLSRPGKMRIDYDPPSKDFIVADGILIYYYDGKMKQQSSAPISRSLANFFLRKELKLSGDISVSDVKRQNNTLQMSLVQTRNPLAGSLTLILSEKPMQLLAWRIVDAQGLVTEVRLLGSEMDIPVDKSKFHYYDPAHGAHLYNNK
jgi:outer membrane lipoprotein-sorting protein